MIFVLVMYTNPGHAIVIGQFVIDSRTTLVLEAQLIKHGFAKPVADNADAY